MNTKNPFVCSKSQLHRVDLMESINTFQKFAKTNEEIFKALSNQAKVLSKLFDPILIQNLTTFTQTHKFKEIIFPFQELDFEELRFSQRKIERCFQYLPQLDPDVTLVEIFQAIEGVPEEQYEEVLISKLGSKKALTKRRINNKRKRKKQLKNTVSFIFSIISFYGACQLLGFPLPPTFIDLFITIFDHPVQAIQNTKEYPAICKGLNKDFLVLSAQRKKRRRKYHRK